MKVAVWLLPLVLPSVVVASPEANARLHKRAVQYVTMVSTTSIPLAQYLQQQQQGGVAGNVAANGKAVTADAAPAGTAAVAAAEPTVAALSTTAAGGSFANWLGGLFGFGSTSAGSTAAAAPAAATATTPIEVFSSAAPAATTAAITSEAATPTTTAGGVAGWLENLLNPETITYTYPGNNLGSLTAGGATGGAATTSAGSGPIYPLASASASASGGNSGGNTGGSGNSGTGSNAAYADNIKYAQQAKGITYSPYNKDHLCKLALQVAYDLEQLSSFSLIRLYSTDCSGIENVLANLNSNQKLFLGLWDIDTASVATGMGQILQALESSSRGWSAVDTILIGNERVNDGAATVLQIQAAVSAGRLWLKQNAPNYSGLVVSVDTLNAVVSNPGLCSISDYIAVNCHPYFTGSLTPSQTGAWLQSQIASVLSACGGSKKVLITETGWPNKGNTLGKCVPSVSNQAEALQSIMSLVGDQLFAFTMYNDYWKAPGQYNVEQNWGIFGDPPS